MRMFDLDETMLQQGPILDCVAGPSSFTAEAEAKGFDVMECDVLYDSPIETLADMGR